MYLFGKEKEQGGAGDVAFFVWIGKGRVNDIILENIPWFLNNIKLQTRVNTKQYHRAKRYKVKLLKTIDFLRNTRAKHATFRWNKLTHTWQA